MLDSVQDDPTNKNKNRRTYKLATRKKKTTRKLIEKQEYHDGNKTLTELILY